MNEINLSLFGERLKEARKSLGLNQSNAADLAGVTREHWGRCERGLGMPGGEVLAALANAGADVRYILTGKTSQSEPVAHPINDRARLASAIEAVEAGLADTKRHLPPKKKAELVMAAYDLMAQPEQSRDNVIRLVRLAA